MESAAGTRWARAAESRELRSRFSKSVFSVQPFRVAEGTAVLSGILECPRHDEPEITKGASF
jgi:hypothetical protein